MIGPILGLGVPGLLAVAGFVYFRLMERRGPVSVADNRTFKLAAKRVDAALADGDTLAARYAMTAIVLWLKREVHTGPRRRRVQRAAQLEQWELRRAQLPPLGVMW